MSNCACTSVIIAVIEEFVHLFYIQEEISARFDRLFYIHEKRTFIFFI